jgi:hypothetical protein
VTDNADSYVTLDAVMVQVLSVTPMPSPFLLTAAGGVASQPDEAQVVTTEDIVRDDVLARVDGWLAFVADDFLYSRSDEDSDETDEAVNLWWALYGQE